MLQLGAQLVRGRGEVKGEKEFSARGGWRGKGRERGLKCRKRGGGDMSDAAVKIMSKKKGIIFREMKGESFSNVNAKGLRSPLRGKSGMIGVAKRLFGVVV